MIRRVERNPSVIAGLKCPPEMWPRFETMIPIARPFASATATMSWPLMMPAPPPMKISVKVPTNSATALRRDALFHGPGRLTGAPDGIGTS